MKKFFKEFKEFISRGNIVDMAVGVIIGTAFSAIVTALTNQILMPLINYALAGADGLENAYTMLSPAYTTNEAGEQIIDLANSIYINWGAFITAIINFLLIALVLFIILKVAMRTSKILQDVKAGTQPKLTSEERKALRAEGKDPHDEAVVKAFLEEKAQKEAAEKAEADAKAKAEAEEAYKHSTEYLLNEILSELRSKKD